MASSVDFANLVAEMQQQRAEIDALRAASAVARRPRPVLPDPDKFNGSLQRFDTWLPSIKAKLLVDGDAIGDSVARFYFVYLNLEAHVQAMVLPQLSAAEEMGQWDHQTILDQLARVYFNPNKAKEAIERIHDISQGADTLATYVAKFERSLWEARGQSWPDANKIALFSHGLNSAMKNRLDSQLVLPHTYDSYVKVVQRLANRHRPNPGSNHSQPAQPQKSSFAPPKQALFDPSTNRTGEPMDLGVVDVGAINVGGPNLKSSFSSRPSSPVANSVSPLVRENRRRQGFCVRCGGKGHWVADCPAQAAVNAVREKALGLWSDGSEGSDVEWNSDDERELAKVNWRNRL